MFLRIGITQNELLSSSDETFLNQRVKNMSNFKNISGKNYSFSELKNRRISFDPDKKIAFTQEEIDLSESLKTAIKNGVFIPWPEDGIDQKNENKTETANSDIVSFGEVEESISSTKEYPKINSNATKEIWWAGPSSDVGGYGKMNRESLERLYLKKDLKIQHELAGLGGIEKLRSKLKITPALNEMLKNKVSDDATSVWAIMPPKFFPRKGRKILFSMIESNAVPPSFLAKCQNADEVWIPSLHNMQIFKEAGLRPPAYHMPLGVDIERYRPFELIQEQKNKLQIKTKGFVFLSVFGWSLRKGHDILFKSYLKEFSSKDDVTLLIVSRNWGRSTQEDIDVIRRQIKDYILKYSKNTEKPPHIVHVGQAIDEDDMPLIYNISNAFALPSRGEGYCLPGLEAGACGIPVIMTRCTGQLDYLNDDNSYLIDIEGYDSKSQEIKEILKISSYYDNMDFAVIGEKGIQQLRETMKFVYENYGQAKEKAEKLRQNIIENFTWNILVDKIYNRLTI